jgi:hypothetical protein
MQTINPPPRSIDLAGLPDEAIRVVESLVSLLRNQSGLTSPKARLSPEEWVHSLEEWAASHPRLDRLADDSRESIYQGRGE